jgi:hypothetical protein
VDVQSREISFHDGKRKNLLADGPKIQWQLIYKKRNQLIKSNNIKMGQNGKLRKSGKKERIFWVKTKKP